MTSHSVNLSPMHTWETKQMPDSTVHQSWMEWHKDYERTEHGDAGNQGHCHYRDPVQVNSAGNHQMLHSTEQRPTNPGSHQTCSNSPGKETGCMYNKMMNSGSIGPAVPVSVQQWQAVHSRQVLPEDEQGWAMLHFPNINIQINEASMKKLSLNLDPHKASRPDEICPCVLKLEKRAHGWNIIHTDSHLPVFHQHWSCSTWPRRMPILHQCSRGENSRIQPTTEPYP